jgi:hypothetical protein
LRQPNTRRFAMTSPAFLKPGRAATPMAFVRAIVQGYARYGIDPSKALRAAQIAPREVGKSNARVTALQFEALNAHAMQELDDEALGWFTRRLPWGSYGMLCRASLSAPDLGVAIKRWCRHHRLLTDDIVLDLQVAGGVATVSITEQRDLGVSASSAWCRACASCTATPAGRSTRASRCAARTFRSRRRRTATPIR